MARKGAVPKDRMLNTLAPGHQHGTVEAPLENVTARRISCLAATLLARFVSADNRDTPPVMHNGVSLRGWGGGLLAEQSHRTQLRGDVRSHLKMLL